MLDRREERIKWQELFRTVAGCENLRNTKDPVALADLLPTELPVVAFSSGACGHSGPYCLLLTHQFKQVGWMMNLQACVDLIPDQFI